MSKLLREVELDKEQINIIFMGNFSYPDGMADSKRIQSLIDYLSENGAIARVLLLRQGDHRIDKTKGKGTHKGVSYFTIGHNIRLNAGIVFALPWFFLQGVAYISRHKGKDSKNILYCYSGLSLENIVFVLAAKMCGYYIILDIVEDNTFIQEKLHPLAKLKWASAELLEKLTPQLADAVVVISHYLKDLYQKTLGAAVPVSFIPISARCSSPREKRRGTEALKFVYTGSFAKKDGVELLITAFEKVSKQHQDCVLLLTGRGANLPEIEKRIADHPAIRHVGYLKDEEFYEFLQEADVLCITRIGSTYANAGFPFKLGEYLATGNPVIVTNVSDVSRYLENMMDAIIIEPDDVLAIEKAMEYCIGHSEEIKSIGRNGQLKCLQHFNPDSNGLTLLNLLRGL